MNQRAAVLALLAATIPVAKLAAQADTTLPDRGKIDGVEDEARRARRGAGGSCLDCGGGFFLFRVVAHAVELLVRPGHGPRYQPYPYADTSDSEPFVRTGRLGRRRFGALTGTWFADAARGATLGAGQVALEGANGPYHASIEYALYREPTRTDTDYLHLVRAGFGAVPRLGDVGYLRFGLGARAIVLDNGDAAIGPELEVGAQLFPVRPLGATLLARGALVNWSWAGGSGFAELTATGSYFTGRYELLAGWRYTRIGGAAGFSGPVAGIRLWF